MAGRKQVFVAYPSRDESLADGILDAVRRANALPLPIVYEPWVFNDISGTPLISPILEKIDESPFVVADITYLNLNVIYEIGFSIGRSKRAFLVRHAHTGGDRDLAKVAGIFDTIGFYEYANSEELKNRLSAHIETTHLPFAPNLDRQAPVFLVEPPTREDDISVLISRIKKARYPYRSFNPDEDTRLSATDAIRQVAASSGIFIPFQEAAVPGSEVHNIRCMFVAGLADGMGKPKLILAPAAYEAPLDIRDEVKPFKKTSDIFDLVANFVPLINEYTSRAEPSGIDSTTLLQSLSIGDPRAENEMQTLGNYYLRTDQFDRALRGEVNLVVGRKGSGKTALWIQVRDRTRIDKRNIVVDLKPEGYQLIKLKEDILAYLSEGARQHLITAFWEYLIMLEVAYKLLEKDRYTYRFNHDIHDQYLALERLYNAPEFSAEGDFSERLTTLSLKLVAKYQDRFGGADARRLTAAEVTELLYSHDIRELRSQISAYLEYKKSVWVLFDNLDKGWSTQGVDVIDAVVLRCLVDAGRKIEREMRKAGHTFHCIVFIRNDVYDNLMRSSADYGKEMRATLDWNDPDMLREILRLRLAAGLNGKLDSVNFDTVWRELCVSHYQGEDTSAYLIDRSLMRPRNFLKLFNHCRGFATNFQRTQIKEDDIEKGVMAYSQDLLEELDRELTDVFPAAKDLLYYFLDAPAVLQSDQLDSIMTEGAIDPSDREKVTDFLLYYGVLGTRLGDREFYIYSVNYDLRVLKIRAQRHTETADYVVNPAFWPALAIDHSSLSATRTTASTF